MLLIEIAHALLKSAARHFDYRIFFLGVDGERLDQRKGGDRNGRQQYAKSHGVLDVPPGNGAVNRSCAARCTSIKTERRARSRRPAWPRARPSSPRASASELVPAPRASASQPVPARAPCAQPQSWAPAALLG